MSVQPAKVNFVIWKGATFSKTLTLNLIDGPMNTGSHSAVMNIKDKPNGTTLFTLSTANGRISMGGTNGVIYLHIDEEDTATFNWLGAVYSLLITDGAGETDSILYGSVKVRSI